MLWMSFERHINAFRTTVLGLEPLRVGEGGWNHLNVMQVTQGCECPSCAYAVFTSVVVVVVVVLYPGSEFIPLIDMYGVYKPLL